MLPSHIGNRASQISRQTLKKQKYPLDKIQRLRYILRTYQKMLLYSKGDKIYEPGVPEKNFDFKLPTRSVS